MPAAPELLQRAGEVGRVEVHGQREAEQQRQADRHVRVGGEVEVELHGVAPAGEESVRGAEGVRVVEERIDEALGEVVGEDRLLEQAGEDQPQRAARVDAGVVGGRLLHLRKQFAGTRDRAGAELREEGEVVEEVEGGAGGTAGAAGDVDDVGDGLERVERDADRQDDLRDQGEGAVGLERHERLRGGGADGAADRGGGGREDVEQEEARVLEEREQGDVGDDGEAHESAPARFPGALDGEREGVVGERDGDEQQGEAARPPGVEEEAGGEQDELPGETPPRGNRPPEQEDGRVEEGELGGREEHVRSGSLGLVSRRPARRSCGFARARASGKGADSCKIRSASQGKWRNRRKGRYSSGPYSTGNQVR